MFIFADEMHILRVFQNLFSNAIKNTRPNGKISISSEVKNNSIILSVSDTGIGLTKEEMEKIFTKNGKIDRMDEDIIMDGFGLGLYLSKEIINLHGGKIWAESEGRNRGSLFKVELPSK